VFGQNFGRSVNLSFYQLGISFELSEPFRIKNTKTLQERCPISYLHRSKIFPNW